MNLYMLALFAHVVGVIGIFAGLGVWIFGTWALRQAERVELVRLLTTPIAAASKLIVGGILVLGIAGFYMAITVWGGQATWIIVATIAFLLLIPVGLLIIDPRMRAITTAARDLPDGPLSDALAAHTHDPLLPTGLNLYIAMLLGIVFIMTNKPATNVAILAAVVAVAVGLLVSLPLWRPRARRYTARHTAPSSRLGR
ncbi:MAG TPA: hypothetical protein VID72_04005 [Ktedonobacterales bacterium]|jgi:membrane protein YdbS with pleckstrin-like domain